MQESAAHPHRRWSCLGARVIAGAALSVVTVASFVGSSTASSRPPAPLLGRVTSTQLASTTWYAPYVDATLPPEYPAADQAMNPANQSVFGFIVAARGGSCTPSWGDYYSLSGIDGSSLRLGSVISTMQAEGETPIVSFGGEANQPLADVCSSSSALASAYQDVVDAYHLDILDFDIEGAAQGNTAALALQAQAIRSVQASAPADHPLGVWLTLPVASTGMLPVAENVVNTMLNGGVALSGVNLMTMYFSPSPGDGAPMLGAVESALEASHAQLAQIFSSHGIQLSSSEVWSHMGATVQIGQAGIPDQAFTVADAQGLVSFAQARGLGRISDWSANQDLPCGSASAPTVGGYSNYCSGVVQAPGQFGQVFGQLTGSATSTTLLTASSKSTAAPTTSPVTTTATTPTTPTAPTTTPGGTTPTVVNAWSATAPYPAGSLVLYAGNEYQAKWWSQGSTPTTDVAAPWDTPWKLVATDPPSSDPPTTTTTTTTTASDPPATDPPTTTTTTTTAASDPPATVPPTTTTTTTAASDPPATDPPTTTTTTTTAASDPPATVPTTTASYPAWSSTTPYAAGDEVTLDGNVYQAKWWNQGVDPSQVTAAPWDTPWTLVATLAPGTQPWTPPTLPAGTYPTWSASTVYLAGDDVLYQGVPYQAKWWNQGDSPAGATSNPYASPWKLLDQVPGVPTT